MAIVESTELNLHVQRLTHDQRTGSEIGDAAEKLVRYLSYRQTKDLKQERPTSFITR